MVYPIMFLLLEPGAVMLAIVILFLSCLFPADEAIVTASSSAGPRYAPKLAFDGDRQTRWSARFEDRSGWIEVTFPQEKMCDAVTIVGEGPELKGMPGKVRVLYLKKGKWYPAHSSTNKGGPEVTLSFEAAASPSWRLQIDSVVNARWSPTVAELRFFLAGDSAKGADKEDRSEPERIAPLPQVTASGVSSEKYAPSLAADNDLSTRWWAPRGETSGWIAFEYGEPQEFNFLSYDVDMESGYGVPRDFRLEARLGKRWKTVLEVEGAGLNYGRVAFRKTKSALWRFTVDAVINPRYAPALSEIRLTLEENTKEAAASKPPPAATPSAGRIRKAIAKGRDYLIRTQTDQGTWETPFTEENPMGVAALGALALLKSGADPVSPAVGKALEKVLASEMKRVYGTALGLMAVCEAGAESRFSFVEKGARFLLEHQDGSGLWGYPDGRPDHSNAQYALLGLHAAAEAGVKIPGDAWRKAGRFYLRSQLDDGGWNYVPSGKGARDPATGSMTAAGIAALLLVRHHGAELDEDKVQSAIDRSFEWLGAHFSVQLNPGSPSGLGHYYYLYGLERVGQFASRSRIGGRVWYGEGAAHLCRYQRSDGGWQGSMVDTCFALLFLTQASQPLSGG